MLSQCCRMLLTKLHRSSKWKINNLNGISTLHLKEIWLHFPLEIELNIYSQVFPLYTIIFIYANSWPKFPHTLTLLSSRIRILSISFFNLADVRRSIFSILLSFNCIFFSDSTLSFSLINSMFKSVHFLHMLWSIELSLAALKLKD